MYNIGSWKQQLIYYNSCFICLKRLFCEASSSSNFIFSLLSASLSFFISISFSTFFGCLDLWTTWVAVNSQFNVSVSLQHKFLLLSSSRMRLMNCSFPAPKDSIGIWEKWMSWNTNLEHLLRRTEWLLHEKCDLLIHLHWLPIFCKKPLLHFEQHNPEWWKWTQNHWMDHLDLSDKLPGTTACLRQHRRRNWVNEPLSSPKHLFWCSTTVKHFPNSSWRINVPDWCWC